MTFPSKLTLPNGSKVTRSPDLIMAVTRTGSSDKETHQRFEEAGFKKFSLDEKREDRAPHFALNESDYVAIYQSAKGEVDPDRLVKLSNDTTTVSAVYYSNKDVVESYFSPMPDVLVVEFETPPGNVEKFLGEKFGLQIDYAKSKYLTNKYYARLKTGSEETAYELQARLTRFKTVREVYFEQIPVILPLCGYPSDPLYTEQWNLERVEWHHTYAPCNQTSVISVIDQGVDLNHPDIDFASQGLNLGTMLPTGSPTGNHGTPCAGIAGAVTNNGTGISGVSGRSKILPLAVATWSDVEIAMGLNYSTSFGADVVSMSFGVYDSWNYWNYAMIDTEITFATNHGTFLCAASGNENSATLNRYPGKHPLVLCVGGSNRDDMRKAVNDGSSQTFWGACYGLETYLGSLVGVDVVAPCLEIPATDRLGGAGYAPDEYYNLGDSYDGFNGTSSATPMVAGLAALIKSAIPDAGNSLVKKIIEKSADKIGPYVYSYRPEFPNSAWTQEVGHGRMNVRRAMKLVEAHLCASVCCDKFGQGQADVIAFSVSGGKHVSAGADVQIKDFTDIHTNTGNVWANSTFTTPKDGHYYFDWTIVKDANYHNGTDDDVSVHLMINNQRMGKAAWSGQHSKRNTGASSIILPLKTGDTVQAWVHSDGGPNRHLISYTLSGFKISG